MITNWDHKFMQLAEVVAGWSKDRSRRVGCIIVGSHHEVRVTGYNGFPRGINDSAEERHERPAKYLWTEHAERNAIFNAARVGVALDGCTLYVCTLHPCANCARAIAQVGIARVVCVPPNFTDFVWAEDFRVAQILFEESAVDVVYYGDEAAA